MASQVREWTWPEDSEAVWGLSGEELCDGFACLSGAHSGGMCAYVHMCVHRCACVCVCACECIRAELPWCRPHVCPPWSRTNSPSSPSFEHQGSTMMGGESDLPRVMLGANDSQNSNPGHLSWDQVLITVTVIALWRWKKNLFSWYPFTWSPVLLWGQETDSPLYRLPNPPSLVMGLVKHALASNFEQDPRDDAVTAGVAYDVIMPGESNDWKRSGVFFILFFSLFSKFPIGMVFTIKQLA